MSANQPTGGQLPSFVNLLIGGRCELRCAYCPNWRQENPTIDAAAWESVFRQLGAWLPGVHATLSGGEPLLHPDIERIARAAGEHGVPASLSTSGSALTPEKARAIAAWGLAGVTLSLDGFAPTHDALRGAPGLHRRAFGLLDYLKELRPQLTAAVGVVIHRANLGELREFAEMLFAKPEVDRVYFQAIVELRRGAGGPSFARPALFPEAAAAAAFLDWLSERRTPTAKIANSAAQIALWRRYFADPEGAARSAAPCGVGERVLAIAANGEVRLCDWHEPLGHVTRDRLRDLWTSPAAQALRDRMSRCVAPCNYLINCGFADLRAPAAAPCAG